MSNGKKIIQDLDLESSIKKMSDRELAEFTVREVYNQRQVCAVHAEQINEAKADITKLKNKKSNNTGFTKRQSILTNLGTVLAAIAIALTSKFVGS